MLNTNPYEWIGNVQGHQLISFGEKQILFFLYNAVFCSFLEVVIRRLLNLAMVQCLSQVVLEKQNKMM